jgi:hypothetical protein
LEKYRGRGRGKREKREKKKGKKDREKEKRRSFSSVLMHLLPFGGFLDESGFLFVLSAIS